ncbi:MAG: hypothetical protein IIY89_00340 [Clostridia bacterium]|nr:hypothetical protein [Clostridia bacterium]
MKHDKRGETGAYRRLTALLTALAAVCILLITAPAAHATGQNGTSSNTVGTTRNSNSSSDPDASVPEVTVSSNPQETLGTVGFSEANTKRITVGKSTVLYLTIKDMGYKFNTTFESSDPEIATVKKIDNRAVKVVGLKSGTVIITATVPKSKTVTISAKYELEIGEGDVSSSGIPADNTSSVNGGGIVNDVSDNTDLDLYSSTADPMLLEYAKARRSTNAATLLLGIIGWGLILLAVGYVFSVVIRSRTPKLNVSPGSRKRYSARTSGSLRSGNRLLPNKYYRNLKKY